MLFAKFAVGLVLLAVLLSWVDWRAAAAAALQADPLWLAAGFLATVLGNLVSAEKWRGLLHDSLIRVRLGLAARLYWIGMFFSNFLPTSVGGDAMRLVLTPAPGRLAAVAGTILIERVTGLVVLLLLCGAGLAAAPWFVAMPAQAGAVELLVVGTGAAVAALLTLPGPILRAAGWLAARLPGPLRRPVAAVERLTGTVAAQARNRRALLRALLLSLPFYLTVLVGQYCALRAVDAEVPIGHVLLLGATVQLMAALPISINGLGVSEGAFVGLYSALGVAPPVALAAAVVRRLVDLANSAVGGVLWLGYRRAEAGRTMAAAAAVEWRSGGVPRPV